jgi:hypothetical protein
MRKMEACILYEHNVDRVEGIDEVDVNACDGARSDARGMKT